MLHLSSVDRRHNQNDDADTCDANRLQACADLVEYALDALIPIMGPLEHPDAGWCPDALSLALQEQAESIKHEQRRLRRRPL